MRSEAGECAPFYILNRLLRCGFNKNSSVWIGETLCFQNILQQTEFERVIGLDKKFAFRQIMREKYILAC
jgi:hypothetical protein